MMFPFYNACHKISDHCLLPNRTVTVPPTALTSSKVPINRILQQRRPFRLSRPDSHQHPSSTCLTLHVSFCGGGPLRCWGRSCLVQHTSTDQKLQPCVFFFSRRLFPVRRNYDIGDQEFQAVQLALEEWRH